MTRPETDAAGTQSYRSGRGPCRTGVSASSFMPDHRSESALFCGKNSLCEPNFGLSTIMIQPSDAHTGECGRRF